LWQSAARDTDLSAGGDGCHIISLIFLIKILKQNSFTDKIYTFKIIVQDRFDEYCNADP
jgi:hypothetical protein